MSDYEKYQELGRKLCEWGQGNMSHKAFQALWKEREDLKNKYAGKVPPKDCAK